MAKSARKYDINNWPEIPGTPISKVGVFPYSGKQIDDENSAFNLEPDKIYSVYRPEEELNNQACIDSFKLVPWIDDHEMLGDSSEGLTPPEEKGIDGVIGEKVYYENGYLKGNPKAYTEKMNQLLASGEKKELSIGYRCKYEKKDGVFEGQPYQFIQREIRGNHLALVDEGRAGPDVAVLDHFKFTFDTAELKYMTVKNTKDNAEEIKKDETEVTKKEETKDETEVTKESETKDDSETEAEKSATLDEVFASARDFMGKMDSYKSGKDKAAKDIGMTSNPTSAATSDADEIKKDEATCQKDEKASPSMDAKLIRKSVFAEMAQKNALAEKLSHTVGTFDHAAMDLQEVATAGLKAFNLKAPRGFEKIVLDAYLDGLAASKPSASAFGSDSAQSANSDYFDKFIKGDNK